MVTFRDLTLPRGSRREGSRPLQLTSPPPTRRVQCRGIVRWANTQGGRPQMNSTRIKTFAILAIALLAAPASAFADSTDSGYSPPGGESPQLAFTGRDLYLWGGLGLLLVGVGLGLRRLTMPTDEEKHRP